jgi:predicted DNA-binding protein
MPSKDRLIFTCPKELQDRLKLLSRKTGAPVAELLRRALVEYLDRREKAVL